MVLSYDLSNLIHLNTESLNGFLEQCQQKGLSDDQIIHQISEEIELHLNKAKKQPNPSLHYNTKFKLGNPNTNH